MYDECSNENYIRCRERKFVMGFRIVLDSCCEIPAEHKLNDKLVVVPFGLEVGEDFITDDENFNQAEFLRKIAAYPGCPKSACPSPENFLQAFEGECDRIYVITISSELSGCYNSAVLAKNMYEEDGGTKKVHIVDSLSASAGETILLMKLLELEANNLPFETIVEEITKYRDEHSIYFVLDNLETLRKNGRLSSVKAAIATTLKIKPVMTAKKGIIEQSGQAIGSKKAHSKLVESFLTELGGRVSDISKRPIVIAHCNAPDAALFIKKAFEAKVPGVKVIINDTRGLSSLYANDGGVIVAG